MAGLAAFVTKRLAAEDLEPANWAPQDKQPGDFVVEALSIRDRLARKRRPGTSSTVRDRQVLYRRAIWLAQIYQGGDWDGFSDNLDAIRHTARDAAPRAAYERDCKLLAKRPDLAAYWLMAHVACDDQDGLADAIERTAGTQHAAIARLRKQLAGGISVIEAAWKRQKRGTFTPPVQRDTARRSRA